jgi:hypothetical protein
MVGRYERWKRSGGPPPAIREVLLETGQDFRLLEDGGGVPHLFRASYDPPRDVRALTSGAHSWTVGNAEGGERILGVEITRSEAVRAHADFGASGVITIDPLVDAAPYVPGTQNDSARLVNRVGKVVTAWGPARSGTEHTLAVVSAPAVGGQALELTATNSSTRTAWCAVGRAFSPYLDLSGQAATGLWVRGDGSGVEVSLELFDHADRRAVVKLPLFFAGWRLYTFPFAAPATFDVTKVKYLVVVMSDLPPESTVGARFALLRATSTVHPPSDLTGVSIEVGGRTIPLPAPLPPGGTARIDALGRLTVWPGGMDAGQTIDVAGGPITVPAGATPIVFRSSGPALYPGDVAVRTSRLLRIHPE